VQTRDALKAGCSHITHFFNAMGRAGGKGLWHHREQDIVSEGLQNDAFSLDFICDSSHLAEHAVQLLVRQKPLLQRMIVSDACPFSGRKVTNAAPEKYRHWMEKHWGTWQALLKGMGAYQPSQVLIGSVATLEQRLEYFINSSGLSQRQALAEFVQMACQNSLRFWPGSWPSKLRGKMAYDPSQKKGHRVWRVR